MPYLRRFCRSLGDNRELKNEEDIVASEIIPVILKPFPEICKDSVMFPCCILMLYLHLLQLNVFFIETHIRLKVTSLRISMKKSRIGGKRLE